MGPGHYWWSDMWWGGGMWIYPLIIVTILLVGVYLIVLRGNRRSPQSSERTETALDMLKKRYARGDISKEEFEQIKKDLVS